VSPLNVMECYFRDMQGLVQYTGLFLCSRGLFSCYRALFVFYRALFVYYRAHFMLQGSFRVMQCSSLDTCEGYRVAKMRQTPYLHESFSAKEPYN